MSDHAVNFDRSRAVAFQYPIGVGSTLTRVVEVSGSGEPVILLHGAGARADRWRTSLQTISKFGRRALAIDLPGHGFATKGEGPEYSVQGFAGFIEGVLDELDIDQATLVGTSLGAHVLATVALNRPTLATKLVLVGPTGVFPLGAKGCRALANNICDTTREGIRRKLAAVISDSSSVDEDWVSEEYRINNSPGATESFARLAAYIVDRLDEDSLADRLRERSPGLDLMLVWGADDVIVEPRTQEEVAERVGDGRVEHIANAGHAPYLEQSDAFWRVVGPFLGLADE